MLSLRVIEFKRQIGLNGLERLGRDCLHQGLERSHMHKEMLALEETPFPG
jgi:hypothetical protein